ncbi:MAG TPA: response regulator [Myxococcales bacterium]|nr:response regulator [Myxococcales bacterium]
MVKALAPRILVVDDDLSAALHCTYALLDAGFEVDIATTRSDAVRLLLERRYAAAVVDLVMPDLGGREVCRAVHALAPAAALVVMGEDPESVARALEPDDYLRRPFTDLGLLDAVARALGRARGRAAPAPAPSSAPAEPC